MQGVTDEVKRVNGLSNRDVCVTLQLVMFVIDH